MSDEKKSISMKELKIVQPRSLKSRLLSLGFTIVIGCLLYTSPSPRDLSTSRMPSSA